jgi:hypothetical protein
MPSNPINLQAIDEKIRKLQQLRSLAEDPEMAEMLKEFTVNGTNGAHSHNGASPSIAATPPAPIKRTPIIAKGVARHSKTKKKRHTKGELAVAVKSAMIPGRAMSTEDIRKRMEDAGFEFKAKYVNIAINDTLRALELKDEVMIHGKTTGQRNLWVLVGPKGPIQGTLVEPESEISSGEILKRFLTVNGPTPRKIIREQAGIPTGSLSHFLTGSGNKGQFREYENDIWGVAS